MKKGPLGSVTEGCETFNLRQFDGGVTHSRRPKRSCARTRGWEIVLRPSVNGDRQRASGKDVSNPRRL